MHKYYIQCHSCLMHRQEKKIDLLVSVMSAVVHKLDVPKTQQRWIIFCKYLPFQLFAFESVLPTTCLIFKSGFYLCMGYNIIDFYLLPFRNKEPKFCKLKKLRIQTSDVITPPNKTWCCIWFDDEAKYASEVIFAFTGELWGVFCEDLG